MNKMSLGSFTNSFKKFLLIGLVLFLSLPALAEENIISSVTISKAKDKVNAYELSIDSTKSVQYKMNAPEDDYIYFDLKNSIASENIDTFYDDAVDIDNVAIKQIEKNRVRIYVKGKDVKNTELIFENAVLPDTNNTKKITLNRPMVEYKPTNSADLEDETAIQDWDDNSFNLVHLGSSFLLSLKDSALGIVLAILAIFSTILVIARSVAAKLSFDKEPLIGLNSSRINVYSEEMPTRKEDDLESVAKRNETLKLAQAQLAQAHKKYQDYLQNKYKNSNFENKPKSIGIDPIKQGIALSQYQKSNSNPYGDQEVIRINKENAVKNESLAPKKPAFKEAKEVKRVDFTSSPYIQRTPIAPASEAKKFKKENNMRFLESVTKIYEQSGRSDLANGLKNTISKAKQSSAQ